jgi:AmiR/NasT family two-component response regulator
MNWRGVAEKIVAAMLVAVLFTAVQTWRDVQDLKAQVRLIQRDIAKRDSVARGTNGSQEQHFRAEAAANSLSR